MLNMRLQHHLVTSCYCSSIKSSVGTYEILNCLLKVMLGLRNQISRLQFCACVNLSYSYCTVVRMGKTSVTSYNQMHKHTH